MKYLFTSIVLLFFIQTGFAQYTNVINSKRPGFSDSPYSVGTSIYQIEGGFYYKNIDNYLNYTFLNDPNIITHNYSSKLYGSDIMFRTGLLFEKLELNIDFSIRNENRDVSLKLKDENNKNPSSTFSTSSFGFDKMNIGAKYLVYEPTYKDKSKEIRSWKARHSFDYRRLIPAVGVYAGINTNIILDDLYKNKYLQEFIRDYNDEIVKENENLPEEYKLKLVDEPELISNIGGRFAIYTQNDLSNRWVIIMNFIMDQVFTDFMESSFIGTTTYAVSEKWSVFGEGQVFFRNIKGVPNDIQFGLGGAYLINKNIQVDLSGRMIKYIDREGSTYLFNSGISWRLDRHKDKIIKSKTNNNEVKPEKEYRSFFDKITFGLFTGSAKASSNKKMRTVKTSKAKTRTLTPPVNKKAQKARNKQNKRLIKEQRKREKSQIKYNKKVKKINN